MVEDETADPAATAQRGQPSVLGRFTGVRNSILARPAWLIFDRSAKKMIPLFKVEDKFQLTGRGCVLVPGIPDEPSLPVVRVKDKIMLLLPDGSKILSHIASIEMVNYRTTPRRIAAPVCLPSELSTEDIPKGTEVFLMPKEEPNQSTTDNSGASPLRV